LYFKIVETLRSAQGDRKMGFEIGSTKIDSIFHVIAGE
jgi:hypothetical protein